MRKIAINRGLKLNEYGVFRGEKMIAGALEEEVYEALGIRVIPPELRENQGEIEASINNRLPSLVERKDIKGDLHCHSNWDGGEDSILEMAKAAIKLGYKYIGISDHTKFLRIENGLSEKELLLQKKEIKKINDDFSKNGIDFRILHGCEANIMKDGSLDIKDEVLRELDYVIAGVHSYFKMTKDEMTDRLTKVMRNPLVSVISHPTGRILKKRSEYEVDFEKILEIAFETKTVLEINSSFERLDLKDIYIRKAKEGGVKMIINTDSHKKQQLETIDFGIYQARRGWAEKSDIINTESSDNILKFLRK
jgi:DNA polymerase (family 10)